MAIGLFHFNIQWCAGNLRSYHRYCSEAIGPFLKALLRNPTWRVSVEICGSGLEFLRSDYPCYFKRLRDSIDRGQIELISSTYTPSLWIAFPGRDLRRSIIRNRRALADIDLVPSKVFFCQESFIGQGISQLTEWFDCAVVKDQYLDYLYGDLSGHGPMFRIGGMPVLIGSNHLMNELSTRALSHPTDFPSQSAAIVQHLRRAVTENSVNVSWARRGCCGELEWFWYHIGDGNHFSTIDAPNNWERFYCDDRWISLTQCLLQQFESDGYSFGTAGDLFAALREQPSEPLPPLIEGSWNTQRSDGIFTWMGRNQNPWENDAGILAYASRTRIRLVQCERALATAQWTDNRDLSERLDEAWTMQFYAESSDPLGWAPPAEEVSFGISACDQVWLSTAKIAQKIGLTFDEGCADSGEPGDPLIPCTILGGQGLISTIQQSPARQMVEASFIADETVCGIRFAYYCKTLVYCPSGMECEALAIPLSELKPPVVYVPLANGLVEAGDGLYVIKDLSFVHVAARIVQKERALFFVVEGGPVGKQYRWRFHIFKGPLEEAVRFANHLNSV